MTAERYALMSDRRLITREYGTVVMNGALECTSEIIISQGWWAGGDAAGPLSYSRTSCDQAAQTQYNFMVIWHGANEMNSY